MSLSLEGRGRMDEKMKIIERIWTVVWPEEEEGEGMSQREKTIVLILMISITAAFGFVLLAIFKGWLLP